jgi:thiaminase/transcriptional activator TenA
VTTYDSPEFQEEVVAACAAVDRAAEGATDEQRASMLDAFVIASRYELMFWDTALHPTPWPAP